MCTGQSIVLVVLTAHRHILQSILFRWEQFVYQDNLRGVAEDWHSARGGLGLGLGLGLTIGLAF